MKIKEILLVRSPDIDWVHPNAMSVIKKDCFHSDLNVGEYVGPLLIITLRYHTSIIALLDEEAYEDFLERNDTAAGVEIMDDIGSFLFAEGYIFGESPRANEFRKPFLEKDTNWMISPDVSITVTNTKIDFTHD